MKIPLEIIWLALHFFLCNRDIGLETQLGIAAEDKAIKITLSFPLHHEKAAKKGKYFSLYTKVVIKNNTDTVASFYEDWNTWGYFNIAFQVRSTKGVDTLYKKMRDWPKNFPSFQVLFPGDSLVLYYVLGNTKYQTSPFKGYLPQPGYGLLGIKAIYQLDSALHASTDIMIRGTIKYRYKREEEPSLSRKDAERWQRTNQWVIIDSLPIPIDARRTFPLTKLESSEVRF